jgi:hypothetical protein
MNDAFEKLEGELMQAVRRGADGGRARLGPRHARTWLLVAAAMLLVSAGALAATRLAGGGSTGNGDQLALDAVLQTRHLPVCEAIQPAASEPQLVEGTPQPAITDVLPSLKVAVSESERSATLAQLTRYHFVGSVFASSVRTVPVTEYLDLLVAVGPRSQSLRDPSACARARLLRAEQLGEDRPASVLKRARWRLAQDLATAPGVQVLYVFERRVKPRHGELGGGGGADSIWSGHPLKPGLSVVANEKNGSRLFVGIAALDAGSIRLATREDLHGLPHVVPVVEGFYAITVPKGIRRFSLIELAHDGRRLRPVDLRQ